jgi:hypothetical protein
MKRLVAIVLVLAMASAASAGIGFTSSQAFYMPGEIVTIYLVASGRCNGFNLATVSDFGAGGAVIGTPTFNPAFVPFPGYIDNTPNIPGAVGLLMDSCGAYASSTGPAAGAILFSFQYQTPVSISTIVIAPVAGGTIVNYDYGTFVCEPSLGDVGGQDQLITGCVLNSGVPEPMTLGLFGLGGLFLRRRIA